MEKLLLKCFGVGDGWPCVDRNHSSFLYQFSGTTFLVDCGESVSSRYKASGLDYNLIDRILISHLHCDHIGGFFMLMQGFWLEKRSKDLNVHLPGYGIEPLKRMLQAAYIFDELLPFQLQFHSLGRLSSPPTIKDIRISTFPTTHLAQLRRAFEEKYHQPFESYSFLFESNSFRVAHSADIGAIDDLIPLVERPLDLLVCELAHVDPISLFQFLSQKKIRRIVFVHASRMVWENLGEYESLARRYLSNSSSSFAKDGEEIVLTSD